MVSSGRERNFHPGRDRFSFLLNGMHFCLRVVVSKVRSIGNRHRHSKSCRQQLLSCINVVRKWVWYKWSLCDHTEVYFNCLHFQRSFRLSTVGTCGSQRRVYCLGNRQGTTNSKSPESLSCCCGNTTLLPAFAQVELLCVEPSILLKGGCCCGVAL